MNAPKPNLRTLLGAICELVNADGGAVYRVHLSTGETIEGQLSPYDDQSDYVRVNPVPLNSGVHGYHVPLAHIVYIQRKQK